MIFYLNVWLNGALNSFMASLEQEVNFSKAVLKGDSQDEGIVLKSLKSVVDGVLPHKG